jgi:hypothetical protein
LWRFDTRSPLDGVKREIQRRKFQATLKPRLDNEIEDWHAAQPDNKPQAMIVEENGLDATGLGPPLSIRYSWNDESETDPTD